MRKKAGVEGEVVSDEDASGENMGKSRDELVKRGLCKNDIPGGGRPTVTLVEGQDFNTTRCGARQKQQIGSAP